MKLKNRIAYSIITYLELLNGANTIQKKETIIKIFESYYGIPLNQAISFKSTELMHKYILGQQNLSVPDCNIASTAVISKFPLFTYNEKDFIFINELKLYRPN